MECAIIESAMSPFTEDSVSAGFDITQDHDTLATQSTMSQPTENAVNTAINTVSGGIATEPVWY